MINSDYLLIYITVPTMKEAKKIAKHLVEKRLAACVNILPGIESIYRDGAKTKEAAEVLLIAKTRQQLFSSIEQAVRKLHSYDTPAVLAINIAEGYPPFLSWINDSTE